MTYELALLEREELGEERGDKRRLFRDLRSVMKSFNVSAEEAIEVLDVPKDEQRYYLSKLNKNFEAEEL